MTTTAMTTTSTTATSTVSPNCNLKDIKEKDLTVELHCNKNHTIQVVSDEVCLNCGERNITTNNCEEKINELCPGTKYNFTAWNDEGLETSCSAKTRGIHVQNPARNLTNSDKSNQTLTFKWILPECFQTRTFQQYNMELLNPEIATKPSIIDKNPGSESCVFTNLTPWTIYHFQHEVCLFKAGTPFGECLGQIHLLNVRTNAGTPDTPVELLASSVGPTAINLEWQPPDEWNGPGSGFYLKWFEKESILVGDITIINFNKNSTTYSVVNLKPWTKYTFHLLAFNVDEDTKDLLESDYIVAFNTTNISAPGAPKSTSVMSVQSKQVDINWEEPFKKNGPINGYLVAYESIGTNSSLNEEDVLKNVTHTFKNLIPYEYYTFLVKAYNYENGVSGNQIVGQAVRTSIRTHAAEPGAPRNVTVILIESKAVEISWEEPDVKNGPIDGYLVSCNGSGVSYEEEVIGKNNTHLFDNLSPFQSYEFSVKAFNVKNDQTGDKMLGLEENAQAKTYSAEPSRPRDLKNVNITSRGITVDWKEPSLKNGPISGYFINVTTLEGQSVHENVNTTQTSFTADNLLPWMNYTISVLAFNVHEVSEVKLLGPEIVRILETDTEIPSTPQKLTVAVKTSSSITVEWTAPTPVAGPTTYTLQLFDFDVKSGKCEGGSSGRKNGTWDMGPENQHLIDSLEPYHCYYAVVVANTDKGSSQNISSSPQRTKSDKPGKPMSLALDESTSRNLTFDWIAPEKKNGPISGYIVNITQFDDGAQICKNVNITLPNFIAKDLLPWKQYQISVLAYNEDDDGGNDLLGPEVSIVEWTGTEAPSSPQSLQKKDRSSTSISITWNTPAEARGPIDGYNITVKNSNYEKFFTSDKKSAVISNLQPYTYYDIIVKAYNNDSKNSNIQLGTEAVLSERTLTAEPSKPRNLKDIENNSRNITVVWEEPSPRNGPISGYTIKVITSEGGILHTVSDVTQNSFIAENLFPWMNYNISVFAFNVNEEGGEALRGPEETLKAKTDTEIPSAPRDLTVEVKSPTSIDVAWMAPIPVAGATNYTLELYGFNVHDKKCEKKESEEKVDAWTLESNIPKTITDLKAYHCFYAVVFAYTEKGQGPNVISHPRRTLADKPSEPIDLKREDGEGEPHMLSISWSRPNDTNGPIDGYKLWYKHSEGEQGFGASSGDTTSFILRDLSPYSIYEVSVAAYNLEHEEERIGANASITLETGIAIPPKPSKNMTNYVPDGNALIETPTSAEFLFPKDLFSSRNGPITGYVVLVAENGYMNLTDPNTGNTPIEDDEFRTWQETKAVELYRASPKDWNPGTVTYSKNQAEDALECSDIIEGGQRRCRLGVQDCKDMDEKEFCNGPLNSGKEYLVKIRAYTAAGYSETNALPLKTAVSVPVKADEPSSLGVIVGVIVGMCFLLGLIGGGGYRYRNHIRKFISTSEESNDTGMRILSTTERPIKTSEFVDKVKDKLADSALLFSQEYEDLKNNSPDFSKDAATIPENKHKNRFINILPYDHSRVQLKPINDRPNSDYINASYIKVKSDNPEYIASQGPLPATVSDFWRMIWENDVRMIVMVTSCVERGKPKCEKYWPDPGGSENYGDMKVVLVSETTFSGYIIRILSVQMGDDQRTIKQLFFTKWPDFGVPENPSLLINFVQAVRDHLIRKSTGPILVHCSAGVGRTGTYIAVDCLVQQVRAGDDALDVFKTVLKMRGCRQNMVQTEDQYIFIHECITAFIQDEESRKSTVVQENGFEIYSNLQECV